MGNVCYREKVATATKAIPSIEQIKMANEEVWASTKKLESLLNETFISMEDELHGAFEQELEEVDLRLSDKWYDLRVYYLKSKNPELDACSVHAVIWKEDQAIMVCE
jgi:hypothetical protein